MAGSEHYMTRFAKKWRTTANPPNQSFSRFQNDHFAGLERGLFEALGELGDDDDLIGAGPGRIRTPTPHQLAIFRAVKRGTQNVMVQAVAGSGKTSTIIHAMGLLPPELSVVYLVFGAKNRDEAVQKLKDTQVQALTLNQIGNRMLPKGYTIDEWKLRGIWKQLARMGAALEQKDPSEAMPSKWRSGNARPPRKPKVADIGPISRRENYAYKAFVLQLVDLARQNGIGAFVPDAPEEWQAIVRRHEMVPEVEELIDDGVVDVDPLIDASIQRGIELARGLLARSIQVALTQKVIDLTDQLYLPLHPDFEGALKVPHFDRIFVDETQDLTPIQVELVAKLMGAKPGEPITSTKQRAVFVGDRWQAIYGWRGAMNDAMDRIRARFECVEFPLSVCWRCDTSIVALAASLGSAIEPAPGKPRGEVVHQPKGEPFWAKAGQVVICRRSAPLIVGALKLLAQGRHAIVLGRNIGTDLDSLVSRLSRPTEDADLLLERLERWEERELIAAGDRGERRDKIRDQAESIRAIVDALHEDARRVEDVRDRIEKLFAESAKQEPDVITFTTIHRSKGLEWPEAVILDWDKLPPNWAKSGWQRQQERHCQYVAVTRAMHKLHLVPAYLFEPRHRSRSEEKQEEDEDGD